MKVIGLTGNIGTGKSAIMKVAANRGALTIDADHVVHDILENDSDIQSKIADAFGGDVRHPNGKINRPALGSIVFSDGEKLEQLEAILHPQVRENISQQVKSATEPLVMVEAIKLLDGPLKDLCDAVWVANCGKLLQLQRLVIARGMDEDEAFKRIVAQSPQAEKVAQADEVISTTGTLASTNAHVNQLLDALMGDGADTATDSEKSTAAPKRDTTPIVSALTAEQRAKMASKLPSLPKASTSAPAEETAEESQPETAEEPIEITVRRARPSDIPSIMLLIHKATDGKVQPKRAEILHSLSDRGYLIGQTGTDITAIAGWYTDKGFAAIEQIYVYPQETASTTGMALLEEIHKTAHELMAEAIFAFMATDMPPFVRELLIKKGFTAESVESFPKVWRDTLLDIQPIGTEALVYKLIEMRIN